MRRGRPLWIFASALAIRLLYIVQIRDLIYFDVPLVDGANYFRTAASIAAGDLLGGRQVFWQPPLYPYFLAAVLKIVGSRMAAIYTVQAVIGASSCLLVYAIGRRLFDERSATAAALITALYGPLIYFDAQPLIPVLHIFLALLGLLLILKAVDRSSAPEGPAGAPRLAVGWGLAGLAWGFSAIATPNILLAVPPVALWAAWRLRADARERVRVAARSWWLVAAFLAGVILPVAAVTARNLGAAGEPVLISSNGGINFYIGNNPDYDRTIRIRPGGEFERLAQEPELHGITGARERSRYFTGRALEFIGTDPLQASRLYLRKALDLIAGREIPRNQELYPYRKTSSILALLLWRFGISFPFGLIAPLALAGLAAGPISGKGSSRILFLLFAASYAISILLFFPTARYRLPLVPIAALFAGRFLAAPIAHLRSRRVAAGLLAGLVLFNLDLLTPSERWPEEESLNRAYALRAKGRLAEAEEEYRRAITLNPRRIDPHNTLAVMAAERGDWETAAGHYRDLLEIAPDFVEVRRSLGQAYLALGRVEEAREQWEIAVHLAPGAALALSDLCLSHLDEGRRQVAEKYCERAVRARPDLAETHFAMALVARSLHKRELAWDHFSEAARLFPKGSPGRARAEEILDRMRKTGGRSKRG